MSILVDSYQRSFHYLRLSVTDECNFRCQYCLPEGQKRREKNTFLNVSEIKHLVNVFASLGITKIRLTGGEPTLRKDFLQIIMAIHAVPNIHTLAVTTNGIRLFKDAQSWFDSGLRNINISVDSLDPRQFQMITGSSKLPLILKGIDRALDIGFNKIKINVVLMRNITDELNDYLKWIKSSPLQLRFIELMETGLGRTFFEKHHCSGQSIQQRLLTDGWQCVPRKYDDGPAVVFSHPDYLGEVGLIMPYVKGFCEECNRLRVSASGQLHLCLFGKQGVSLRDLLQSDSQYNVLQQRIIKTLAQKKGSHFLQNHDIGMTETLSMIGG